jgi:putative DNA primase/helicase
MLTCCPLMLSDGRIIDRPGFDAASGILFNPQGADFPPIPNEPSQDEAIKARDHLRALFSELPFVDDTSKAVLLSALLTATSRPAYSCAPLFAFDAPAAGTGKSKLVDCCSILANGYECPVVSQGDDKNEFEKRLGTELIEGARMISIDNCEQPLGGVLLNQTMTQQFIKVRILGQSKAPLIANSAMVFATGNNLRFYGDMLRRGLICRLDAGVERPELRSFKQRDPVEVLRDNRALYVADALIILRAYHGAKDRVSTPPFGGFEGWSRLVRDALVWLGEKDPVSTIETARAEDPERQRLAAVILQWNAVLSDRSLTASEAVQTASAVDKNKFTYPDFRNALLEIAGDRGQINSYRLGKWLGRNKLKAVGAHRFAPDTPAYGNARWRLQTRNNEGWN